MLQFADGSHSATILHIFPVLCSWLRVEDLQSLNLAWHWCEKLARDYGIFEGFPTNFRWSFLCSFFFCCEILVHDSISKGSFSDLCRSPLGRQIFFHSKLGCFGCTLWDLRLGFLHARFVAQRQSTPAVARGHVARGGSILWAALSLMVLRWPMWFLSLDQVPNGFSVIITIYPFWWASAGSRSIQF